MDMAPNKMKTPMKMAPNKMKSPMKGNAFTGAKAKAEASGADSFSVDGKEFPIKMKSPMKMGSAYKMDKSAFKLKSAPVNMNTPGSVAKLAGVSPMKEKPGSTQEKTKNKKSTDEVVNPDTNVVTDVATQRLIEAGAPKEVIEKAKAKFIARKTSKKK